MKIIDNVNTTVEFSAIKTGECFLYDNCLFIKIHPVKEENRASTSNAFCFVDNALATIPTDWPVTPVEADVVIRSKGVKNDA